MAASDGAWQDASTLLPQGNHRAKTTEERRRGVKEKKKDTGDERRDDEKEAATSTPPVATRRRHTAPPFGHSRRPAGSGRVGGGVSELSHVAVWHRLIPFI